MQGTVLGICHFILYLHVLGNIDYYYPSFADEVNEADFPDHIANNQ